jgi:hypothetical protein
MRNTKKGDRIILSLIFGNVSAVERDGKFLLLKKDGSEVEKPNEQELRTAFESEIAKK